MALQILGLRDYADPKTKKTTKKEVFFSRGYRAPDLESILADPAAVVNSIPEDDRFNLYFTVADCFEESGRKLKEQHYIPFDIDKLDGATDEEVYGNAEKVAKCAIKALGLEYNQVGVIFSGNGVQFFVRLSKPILDENYFDTLRQHYITVLKRIQGHLHQDGLVGEVDPSVFSKARLMRLPNTWNVKPGKPRRLAKVLQPNLVPVDFYLDQLSGIAEMQAPEHIPILALRRMPKPDTQAVISECSFIKWGFEHPADVPEPQWYAQISIVGQLEDGVALCHKMSEGHPKYNIYETDEKIEQAARNAGPRTCKNISTFYEGCKTCPHYGTITSPIQIKGAGYIATSETGFRELRKTKDGSFMPGKVSYDDLAKQFAKEHPYAVISGTKTLYIYNGTHWHPLDADAIRGWAKEKIKPSPMSSEFEEFYKQIMVTNLHTPEWLVDKTDGLLNFQNGVLNLETFELSPHSPLHSFVYVLPYAYDPTATAPRWEEFLSQITNSHAEIIELMEQFAGYAICDTKYRIHKALSLWGKGRNGKNTYAETVGKVVGPKNHSSVQLQDMVHDNNRVHMVNKMFNISEEVSFHALKETSFFKTVVAGGVMSVYEMYKNRYEVRNRAKFILLGNNMPYSSDRSDGLYNRLIVINLKNQYIDENDDKELKTKLEAELPGICNRFIAAYRRLKANRYLFPDPEEVKAQLVAYKEANASSVQQFLRSIQQTGRESDYVPQLELYKNYEIWCNTHNERVLPSRTFGAELKELLPEGATGSCIRINGKATKVTIGIKLNEGDY